MKYSNNFERDYQWFLFLIENNKFTFDGTVVHRNKKGEDIVVPSSNGKSAKYCFYKYDTEGKIVPTSEPDLLTKLLRAKGSVNLHIKMYAEDRASGVLPKILFEKEICKPLQVPDWFIEAVENQKCKYY